MPYTSPQMHRRKAWWLPLLLSLTLHGAALLLSTVLVARHVTEVAAESEASWAVFQLDLRVSLPPPQDPPELQIVDALAGMLPDPVVEASPPIEPLDEAAVSLPEAEEPTPALTAVAMPEPPEPEPETGSEIMPAVVTLPEPLPASNPTQAEVPREPVAGVGGNPPTSEPPPTPASAAERPSVLAGEDAPPAPAASSAGSPAPAAGGVPGGGAGAAPDPGGPSAGAGQGGAASIDAEGLRKLHAPAPRYPASAKRRGQEGSVQCRLRIDREGRVLAVELVASSGTEALDQAALEALRSWRFAPLPQTLPGTEVWALQRMSFRLKRKT